MTTYKDSGVDISAGDKASEVAYEAALKTFPSRRGMIGEPIQLKGSFAGALDFGDYYLVLGSDGVGTKIEIALKTDNFEGLGYDLLAMVADDAICVGAETIAITNTVDTNKVNAKMISVMMESLQRACTEQKVVIPGGEIAELGDSIGSTTWNASGTGIVEKDKYITGEKIQIGDTVLSLKETGFRSNGFSLIRHICQQQSISYADEFENGKSWGETLLTPAKIYNDSILSLTGRFGQTAQISIHGIAHITGGGIAGNLKRILRKKNLGAHLPDIWEPPEMMLQLQKKGRVEDREAYATWNMGNGMLLVVSPQDADKTVEFLGKEGVKAQKAGEITESGEITHQNFGAFQKEEFL